MIELGATTIVGLDTDGHGDDSFDDLLRQAMQTEAQSLPSLAIGQLLDHAYRIEAEIGRGGMGRVYRAHDVRLERDVAIKVHAALSIDGQQWSLREATALARLSHPNVVTVYEVGVWDGHPWVAMEYVPGGTARVWSNRTPSEIIARFVAAGRGLVAAHAAGIIHRDFKPDNVLVGADDQPRVADFGLALHLAKSDGNATNLVMGTPAYMAPEQWDRGAVDQASDQFAFAGSLWELATGERPYRGRTEAEIRASWKTPPVPAKPLPRHVEAALRRALSPVPADRWPSFEGLLAELSRDPARTRRRGIGIAAACAVFVGIGAAVASGTAPEEPPPCEGVLASFRDAEQKRAALPVVIDPPTAKLDAWMARWRTSRVAACHDTYVNRTQPIEILELREQCFDRARAAVEASLVDMAKGADRSELIDALPRIEVCNDVTAIKKEEPLPADPRLRREIAAIEEEMAKARVHRAAGRTATGLDLVEALPPRAKATGRKALEAQVLLLLGNLRIGVEKTEGVQEIFERAAKLSAEASNDRLIAKSWMSVLDLHIMRNRNPAEAERLLPIVDAAILRAGNTEEMRADVLGTIADVDQSQGRYQLARERYEEGVRLYAKVYGEDAGLARMLNRLAAMCTAVNDFDAAREHLHRARELLERNYGPAYPHIGVLLTTLGDLEYKAGNYAEARATFERAIAHKEASGGVEAPGLVNTLTSLGVLLYSERELEAADQHLARAMAIGAKVFANNPERTLQAIQWRITVLVERGKFAEAEVIVREALPRARAAKLTLSVPTLEIELARIHGHAKRFGEAREALDRANPPPGSRIEARMWTIRGEIEEAAGNPEAAGRAWNKANQILRGGGD